VFQSMRATNYTAGAGRFRAAQAAGVSSATRLAGKSAGHGNAERGSRAGIEMERSNLNVQFFGYLFKLLLEVPVNLQAPFKSCDCRVHGRKFKTAGELVHFLQSEATISLP
jgi:hypothetical protein